MCIHAFWKLEVEIKIKIENCIHCIDIYDDDCTKSLIIIITFPYKATFYKITCPMSYISYKVEFNFNV